MRALLLLLLAATCLGAQGKPNFGGAWRVNDVEIYIIEHDDSHMRVVMFVDNSRGKRTLDVKGPIDGQPHAQTVNGSPCVFVARWEGDSLYWETNHDTPAGALHSEQTMRLSADGMFIAAHRVLGSLPQPAIEETWTKQDAPHGAPDPTGFNLRRAMDDAGAELTGTMSQMARGTLAVTFNNMPMAERFLLPLIRTDPKSPEADRARALLQSLYDRNGQERKAAAQCKPGDCSLLEKVAKYPEVTVASRGYGRVQATKLPNGKLLAPVTMAGKSALYQVDTGSNMSLIRESEALRLGLKLEPVSQEIEDLAGVTLDAYLTVVPTLSLGKMRLKHVPFWVVKDARLEDAAGLIGIDVLLQFQTVRWNASGIFEVGFPAQPADISKANLCFENDSLLTAVSSNGQDGLSFVVDTGMDKTTLYVPFAARFLDLVSSVGKQSVYQLVGEAGARKLKDLVTPRVPLLVGGLDVTLDPAVVFLEQSPDSDTGDWHYGRLGIDLFNRAETVTFDFAAMRMTVQGKGQTQPVSQ